MKRIEFRRSWKFFAPLLALGLTACQSGSNPDTGATSYGTPATSAPEMSTATLSGATPGSSAAGVNESTTTPANQAR